MKLYYFDNSATSNPKPETVYLEVGNSLRNLNSNPGRGGHQLAVKTAEAIYKVRKKIKDFFNFENELNLAFMNNSTTALNYAVRGVMEKDALILTSNLEHNSTLRPIYMAKDEFKGEIEILQGENLEKKIENRLLNNNLKKPKILILNHMSNVTGKTLDIENIGKICRMIGVIFILDASQSAGIITIDMIKMNIDILCFTGHKSLFGIQGIGGICLREGITLKATVVGGTGSHTREVYQPLEMPEHLEAGTLNVPGIISLGAGIDFINSVGIKNIHKKELLLKKIFIEGIKKIDKEKKITLYTSYEANDGPVVSMNIEGITSSDLSSYLDEEFNIITRSGLHCAPLIHKELKTEFIGATRFSFGYFNTEEEIDYAVTAVETVLKQI
ncbi:MAG: aminotransferase class V-fold PLP-dependent enzyme [Fusobacteriaceae bacterium]